MDTKKRTTLLLILAIALFMLWDNWQVYRGGTSLIFQHEAKKTDSNAGLPEVPIETAVPVQGETDQTFGACHDERRCAQSEYAENDAVIGTDIASFQWQRSTA